VQEPDRPVENTQFGIAIVPQHPNISLSCRRRAAVEETGLVKVSRRLAVLTVSPMAVRRGVESKPISPTIAVPA
jgi:hypothetical protein